MGGCNRGTVLSSRSSWWSWHRISLPAPTDSPQSLLLVTLDTTRVDHLGCYGSERTKTPHFDALAADGVRFENALAQAAITPASHASILTGLYPHHHGVRVIYASARASALARLCRVTARRRHP
jgi:arylsulfatase A-like enzyme